MVGRRTPLQAVDGRTLHPQGKTQSAFCVTGFVSWSQSLVWGLSCSWSPGCLSSWPLGHSSHYCCLIRSRRGGESCSVLPLLHHFAQQTEEEIVWATAITYSTKVVVGGLWEAKRKTVSHRKCAICVANNTSKVSHLLLFFQSLKSRQRQKKQCDLAKMPIRQLHMPNKTNALHTNSGGKNKW